MLQQVIDRYGPLPATEAQYGLTGAAATARMQWLAVMRPKGAKAMVSGLWGLAAAALLGLAVAATAQPTGHIVRIQSRPEHGIVMLPAPPSVERALSGREVWLTAPNSGKRMAAQYVSPMSPGRPGSIVCRVDEGAAGDLRLAMGGAVTPVGGLPDLVQTAQAVIGLGGAYPAPGSIGLPGMGEALEKFTWNDRVYTTALGGWNLRFDPKPLAQVVSTGPVCTVVRVSARYCREDGTPAPGGARAVYDWYYFRDRPLCWVNAEVRQDGNQRWDELHFLEFNFADRRFTDWSGGNPRQSGAITGSAKGFTMTGWGAVRAGKSGVALIGPDVRVYDGAGGYGSYLHANWQSLTGPVERFSCWLWLGGADDPFAEAEEWAGRLGRSASAYLTLASTRAAVGKAQASADRLRGAARASAQWRAAAAARLEQSGRWKEATRVAAGTQLPAGWTAADAGAMRLAVARTAGGLELASLDDMERSRALLAPEAPPLFSIALRKPGSDADVVVTSEAGWRKASCVAKKGVLTLAWSGHTDPALKGVSAMATAAPVPGQAGFDWRLTVATTGTPWAVRQVAFPQVRVARPGTDPRALFPTGPGVELKDAWEHAQVRRSMYPNGWCSMQLLAAYGSGPGGSGLYFAMHDPGASTKEIVLDALPQKGVLLTYDHPAPNPTTAGNGYRLPGVAAWRLLRGDWFDASRIYRRWVSGHAPWWPKLGRDGRDDTPLWLRELPGWALASGSASDVVPGVTRMREELGVDIGFHWYSWHVIPFDNDYPHYFPTRPGMAEGVAQLTKVGVHTMPYINGRLWDTRDRGAEDFEFTKRALPSVTKDETGKPITETYGSKEADGSPVVLGVMCPTAPLWRETVRDIVLRLVREVGVHGVYIDQIAAASPALCMDPTHGHALGGGDWWCAKGYWPLLTKLQAELPADKMITTECNAEPYVKWMDGYLTWHWQFPDMVPVFPAVYAGAVQLFSRAYNAGAGTRLDALCAKMAQQLVYGEQIGWLDPAVAQEAVAGPFLRETIRLRSRFARHFYAGRMARPVMLVGDVPAIRSDWAWYGETWITTPAVQTGSWLLPGERKLLILFANSSAKPVAAQAALDLKGCGIPASGAKLSRVVGADGDPTPAALPASGRLPLELPGRSVEAWVVSW